MGGDRLVKKTKHKHRSTKRHLQLKTTADNPSPPPLPEDLIEGRKIVSYNAESVLEAKSADSIAINSKSFDFMDDYLIFGSCNGLLCVFQPGENSLILWNPCMNLKSETSITFVSPFGENGFISYHGFGCYDYDQVYVKYKLLIVSYNVDDFSETVTRMYTSGEDSWRTIQDFPYRSSSADENRYLGKFVSGNLNWLAKKEDEYDIVIVKTLRSRLMLHNIIKGSSSLRRPCRWIRFDDLQIYHESLVLPQW
ncbi:hypothetical protein P8452_04592 [Trifolium repens]|nr:hypothetical protein P8452_04592 [Trifolium repens]